ncbi:MAG: riboflavin synthase [Bacteroidetes bacterium]|nr:riboflavin synthase [Bacteroidota bacterium]
MFSGIIEVLGEVVGIQKEQSNLHLTVKSLFTHELKIDQSVAHNGVCLTVVGIQNDTYTVTAIDETIKKTNIGLLNKGDVINLERCLKVGDRLDGHIVQGHVDQRAVCTKMEETDGSWTFTFEYDATKGNVTVEKGSVCVNGVSLTVVNSKDNSFSVCIIPYTFEHTNFKTITPGAIVNIEFDIVGKYIAKMLPKA